MQHTTLAEAMLQRICRPFQRPTYETFWALRDVSLDVRQGEIIGILGRNGAGKSTLLKILSRITEPTSGRIDLWGRIGSLLEVGTGFHPELTGRENIFLNGQILGMRKREVDSVFDEIVGFAGVEKFLDTPVKRYSSGMYVRLAFSVAAHLTSDILIVDEVLAVGDAKFQQRCLGKMKDIGVSGRTVFFVSHNMAALSGLCTTGCLLQDGRMVMTGRIDEVVTRYLAESVTPDQARGFYRHRGVKVTVERVELLVGEAAATHVQSGNAVTIRVYYRSNDTERSEKVSVSLLLYADGVKLVNLWTNYTGNGFPIKSCGYVDCHIARWPIRSRRIRVDVYTHIGAEVQDWLEECLTIESRDGDYYSSGVITNADQGLIFLNHEWSDGAVE